MSICYIQHWIACGTWEISITREGVGIKLHCPESPCGGSWLNSTFNQQEDQILTLTDDYYTIVTFDVFRDFSINMISAEQCY